MVILAELIGAKRNDQVKPPPTFPNPLPRGPMYHENKDCAIVTRKLGGIVGERKQGYVSLGIISIFVERGTRSLITIRTMITNNDMRYCYIQTVLVHEVSIA